MLAAIAFQKDCCRLFCAIDNLYDVEIIITDKAL
jgi:hypothetical protein